MARLIAPRRGLGTVPSHRFIYDGALLLDHLGIAGHPLKLGALCSQFGLKAPGHVGDVTHWGGGYWPMFNELAERMDRPLGDMQRFVLQVR